MKTQEDLRQFYETNLIHALTELEEKRKAIAKKIKLSIAIGAGACIFIAIFLGPAMILLFPIAVIALILIAIFASRSGFGKTYASEFKSRVIQEIIKFIDPGLIYTSTACISEPVFMLSDIFKTNPDRYGGDDLVQGKIGETAIEFCELHAEYKTETTDSDGHRRTEWHTIFKGLFIMAEFNKHFNGKTIVLPDIAERLFGGFGKILQGWNALRPQLIKLEDPEFEKLFAVYGTDQVEARYILSTSLMERIMNFKQKTGKKISLSFVGSKIFIAIPYGESLFEPRLFRTIIDFEPIKKYFDDLQLALGVVEDLNLNTRIWSKQ